MPGKLRARMNPESMTYLDMETKQEYPFFKTSEFETVHVDHKISIDGLVIEGLYVMECMYLDLLNYLLELDACRILNHRASSALNKFKEQYFEMTSTWTNQVVESDYCSDFIPDDSDTERDMIAQIKKISKSEQLNEQRLCCLALVDFNNASEARQHLRSYYHSYRVVDITPLVLQFRTSRTSSSKSSKKTGKKTELVRLLVSECIKRKQIIQVE